ncbi:PREDICTED: uncharacterized protein LOC104799715 [Tarenaya hassleriana]|uniref:uncharacterized protein LOC104799715 n=1 Tax=Tarenaya hassleriana TaxID=28532 RepID=UPI00053C7B6B|nr:PREDICTED: uncharacterized protein LOC104799715 [Tarenaya hassleriana]
MAKSFLIALLVSALAAHPIFGKLYEFEDASSPVPSHEFIIEVPDVEPELVNPPAQAYDSELFSHYSPERLKYLHDCSEKSSSKCGDEVLRNAIRDSPVSRDCCVDLLKLGKECHLSLIQLVFSTYEYKDMASKGVPKSKQTWNMCVNMVGSEIGAPVSLEN